MIIFDRITVSTELPSKTTRENKVNSHLRDLEGFGQDFPMFLLVLHSTQRGTVQTFLLCVMKLDSN
jgi:hypothetical protein